MPDLAAPLLTYLLHSSLLLGLAALLRLVLGERRLGLQEAGLRAALLGGFVSTGLTCGLGLVPALGRIPLAPAAIAPMASAPEPAALPGPDPAPGLTTAAEFGGARESESPLPDLAWTALWRPVLAGAWGALALVGLARLAASGWRLRRLLRGRADVADVELVAAARATSEGLGLTATPPLSLAPGLAGPVATGFWRPEICLPPRALSELGREEQLALCAHELAHVARRDPAWLLAARLAEALAPLQPLNRWARRRLQDLAECLSDDLAVAATQRAHGLARSLVDVAAWSVPEDRWEPAAAVGALSVRSRLGHRVERLMDPLRTLELPRRSAFPLALALTLAVAFVAPAFSSEPQPAPAPVPEDEGLLPEDALPPEAPAPPAPPAPAARPAAPAPAARPAPPAPPAPPARLQAVRELDEIAERLTRRVEGREADLAGLEKELESLVERLRPQQAEVERLARELAGAEAGSRAEELRRELHAHARELRVPEAEMQALQEKARALAEAARPSESELQQIRELSQQAAHDAGRQARDAGRQARDAARQAREEARAAAEEARAAARLAREDLRGELRRMSEELRRVGEEMRRAAEEVRRATEEAVRDLQ